MKTVNGLDFYYNEKDKTPVFCQYDGQINVQGAYIEFDSANKGIYISYNGEIGNAVPADVWNNIAIRFSIPCNISQQQISDVINDAEFQELAKKFFASYKSVYNGNNYVGTWDEDIQGEMQNYIDSNFSEENGVEIADACDWLDPVTYYRNEDGLSCEVDDHVITKDTTDEELKKIEEELESATDSNQYIYNIDKYLNDIREVLKENN